MAIIDRIFNRKKTLSQLDRAELRREEILLSKQRDKLFQRAQESVLTKQKIFSQGAQQKTPELRKALAQEFELKTQEQVMVARELTLRSKELLTISRLRMIRENQGRGRSLGRLNLTDKDVAKMSQWIEDDGITQDMYQQRLDMLLEQGAMADKDAVNGSAISSAGQELMDLWSRMDRGAIQSDKAFEQADLAVRRHVGEGSAE
jgi:hypothetical protein